MASEGNSGRARIMHKHNENENGQIIGETMTIAWGGKLNYNAQMVKQKCKDTGLE